MRSALSTSLVVIGLAVLSMTPASPQFLRDLDLTALYLFRAMDVLLERAVDGLSKPRAPLADPVDGAALRQKLRAWDDVLLSGAGRYARDRRAVVARIVEVEAGGGRFVIDAGPAAMLQVGAAVLAGDVGIGFVTWAQDGVAVVRTPFCDDTRVAGLCTDAYGRPVPFVLVGTGEPAHAAKVTHPERQDGLTVGAEVRAPDVTDLLPPSVTVMPAGVRLGVLALDPEETGLRGQDSFLMQPILTLDALDAVAVVCDRFAADTADAFIMVPGHRLTGGMLTPWRDGFGMLGSGFDLHAAVTQRGCLVGHVEALLAGAARVRGLGDQSDPQVVVVIGGNCPYPLAVRSTGLRKRGIRFTLLVGDRCPVAGDWIVSGGRGRNTPRGVPIGVVLRAWDGGFEVQRYAVGGDPVVLHRSGFPTDPWREAGQ